MLHCTCSPGAFAGLALSGTALDISASILAALASDSVVARSVRMVDFKEAVPALWLSGAFLCSSLASHPEAAAGRKLKVHSI